MSTYTEKRLSMLLGPEMGDASELDATLKRIAELSCDEAEREVIATAVQELHASKQTAAEPARTVRDRRQPSRARKNGGEDGSR